MDEETQRIIEDQMATLPPEINTVLANFDWASKSNELGTKYQLHIDQLGSLQTEILLVLIGIVPPDEFENELKAHLDVPREKITLIVQDANEMIFKPIRQSLVDIYDQVLTDEDVVEEPNQEANPTAPATNTTDREALIAAIENPPASPTTSMPKLKTLEAIRMPKQETDYSLIKEVGEKKEINQPAPTVPEKKIDPYREIPK